MSIVERIAREPVAIAGVLVGLYGLSVAFDIIEFTETQFGAITTFAGAVVFAIRWLTTPAAEVVAQQQPNKPIVAGPAADNIANGTPVNVLPTAV